MSTPNPSTTPWVPLWSLNGGTPLNYKGAYVSGNYSDGDIVVQNGVAYVCVRPTSNPPAVWPMAPGTSNYGTTLPTSPYDGQEAVLVDSITNSTYQWHFRYNASATSPSKWEYVGGVPLHTIGGSISTSSTTPVAVTGAPTTTVPRTGLYNMEVSAQMWSTVASGGYTFTARCVMSVHGNLDLNGILSQSAWSQVFPYYVAIGTPLTAGETLNWQCFMNNAAASGLAQCRVTLTPVRVS